MNVEVAAAVLVGLAGLVGWVYKSITPPKTILCGRPGGPPITAPRIKLRDGRYLAYNERGVPKEKAKFKVIVFHGFSDSKDMSLPYPKEIVEELGIYFLLYDRPGYGESDPNPNRNPKDDALDVEELAEQLQLGKFYGLGLSMGGYVGWGVLLYIPHRLAGLAQVAPMMNYYWPSFPSSLVDKAFKKLPVRDQWTLRMAAHFPWLFYWWMTQNLFPALDTNVNNVMFTPRDLEMFAMFDKNPENSKLMEKSKQQGLYVSQYQDMMASYGKWKDDPMKAKNPFPNNEGVVQIWQGSDDRIIPLELTRYVGEKLSFAEYIEIKGAGHMFFHYPEKCEAFLRRFLLGDTSVKM